MLRKDKQNAKSKYNLNELEKEAAVICQDFTVFCDYVMENKVKLAKKTGNIGKKDCFALNSLLHVRQNYENPTYFQSQYPIINFFYYIAVKYKILEKNPSDTGLQKGKNYHYFSEASVWEKYVLFLTVFLFDGMFAGSENSWYPNNVSEMWDEYIDGFMEWVAMKKPGVGCKCRIAGDSGICYFSYLDIIMPYLDELHLIKVWRRPDSNRWDRDCWWEIEALPLLEMVSDLYESTDIDEDVDEQNLYNVDFMVKYSFEAFTQSLMQEKCQNSIQKLFGNTDPQNREQIIDLEVSVRHTDCIRVVRMNLRDSLYDLHLMIQKAVEFDNDHLFEFSIGSGMMKRTYVMSGYMNSGREFPVEETRISDLELSRGQKFTYLFDFGDMWWFDIKVLGIQEGTMEAPEVIKVVNEAPEQYPDYEEEMDEWEVEISDQVQISDILASIDDELIREEYAALTGMKDGVPKEAPAVMRQEMEKILLQKPDRMLTFMTEEMRKMLSDLLQNQWIDGSERCMLAKLYSFGFCQLPEEDDYVVIVPEPVKEIYSTKIKTAGKKDKIVDTAETFLRRCGVMEMSFLHSTVAGFVRSRISYEEFEYLVYSRLHYFGAYYCDCYDGVEYMSCYDREMTQKILAERQRPENAVYDYPDIGKADPKKQKEIPRALENWTEYVRFNLNIDWQTAQRLMMQIPAMAVSGIIEKEEIVAAYKEILHGTGSRVTKKAENLISELCTTMPLATKKGNTGLEDCGIEKSDSDGAVKAGKAKVNSSVAARSGKAESNSNRTTKAEKMEGNSDRVTKSRKTEGGEGEPPIQEEYTQLSIFDL